MSMNVGGNKGAMSNINITPYIDILLVLLIIFMVITPVKQMDLDVKVPQPSQDEKPVVDPNVIVVSIGESARIAINQEETSIGQLQSKLQEIYSKRANKSMFVSASPKLAYSDVVRVIDIHDERLRYSLAEADRNRPVRVCDGARSLRDEQMPLRLPHGLKDSLGQALLSQNTGVGPGVGPDGFDHGGALADAFCVLCGRFPRDGKNGKHEQQQGLHDRAVSNRSTILRRPLGGNEWIRPISR